MANFIYSMFWARECKMRKRYAESAKLRKQKSSKEKVSPAPPPDLDLQMLLDVMPFYVMLIDAEHKILLANKALRRDLGLDPEKIVGGYCRKWFTELRNLILVVL